VHGGFVVYTKENKIASVGVPVHSTARSMPRLRWPWQTGGSSGALPVSWRRSPA
jgi:hypothetical protein